MQGAGARRAPRRSMAPRVLLIVAVASAVSQWTGPRTAVGQPPTTTAPATAAPDEASRSDAEARAVFVRGREAYERGDFETALASFRRAYELSGRPALLFNVGQAADRLRRDREALEAFEAYLAAVPDAGNRAEVEARIRVLREQIARDEALRAELASASQRRDEGAHRSADGRSVVTRWWFWTLVGAAVVGVGVAIAAVALGRDELAPPTPGQLGPGGYIVALESR
ncbi:MAG: hypothetical protein NZ898_16760 [Myxococcota bacterium]|nr:hypothetical protein [Myxococcota bacterium]MDW8363616.1 hypothetical protein [Myxococcales bacterium]